MNSLTLLLQDHEIFHSEFQIRNFIIARSGGTHYGAYKQAIRELWHRLAAIVSELHKSSRVADSAAHHEIEHVTTTTTSDHDWCESTPAMRDTLRECVILYFLAKSLREKLGNLDYEMKLLYEEELWVHRARCAIAIDFLSAGHISCSTVELVHSLPLKLRNPILESLLNPVGHESLVRWYLAYSLELPSLDSAVSTASTHELLQYAGETVAWLKRQVSDTRAKNLAQLLGLANDGI
jgi:hypothetical protein